jgi:hypothetical protein
VDWWDKLGNYAAFFPDSPALAVDMTTNHHMSAGYLGYPLAYGLQDTPTQIQVYPPDNPFLEA